jgi:hypothetical protein
MAKEVFTTTVRVESLVDVEIRKENVNKQAFKMTGQDSEKIARIVFVGPHPFMGLKPGDLVDVTVSTSQTSIKDFDPEAAAKKEKKEVKPAGQSTEQKSLVKGLKGGKNA